MSDSTHLAGLSAAPESAKKPAPESPVADKDKDQSAWGQVKDFFGTHFTSVRRATIKALPAPIVNNASNVLAGMHIVSEFLMFKANGTKLVEDHEKGNPLNYLIKPPQKVFDSFMAGAKSDMKLSDLTKPAFYQNTFKSITDPKAATVIDRAVNPKLINRWQSRASLSGLITWTLSLVIPEKPETPEDVEKMTILANTNPVGYVGERLKQAVWVPEWSSHKREFTGLGIFISGMCSFLGGFRNVRKLNAAGTMREYYFNPSYCVTGLVSWVSSLPLLFGTENNVAWGQYGMLHLGRTVFLPGSISKKFKAKDLGAGWYTAGATSFQLENAAAALVGGAQKLPDGTIVDNNEARKNARDKAIQLKHGGMVETSEESAGSTLSDEAPPTTQISAIAERDHAMPHRVEAFQAQAQQQPQPAA